MEQELLDQNISKQDSLKQKNIISQKKSLFIKFFAFYCITIGFLFIFMVVFYKFPNENQRIVDMITGAITGTVITTIINYFFGNSL